MPKITVSGIEEYIDKLEKLGVRGTGIMKMGVYDGAAVVADQIRENLNSVVSESATGDLAKSLGISEMEVNRKSVSVNIGFSGYDRKGVANQLKANVLESGSSKQKKRPFFRPAVNASRKKATLKMIETISEEINRIFK